MIDTHLCIATPCYSSSITLTYHESIVALMHEARSRGLSLSTMFNGGDSLVTRARNQLVNRFLEEPSLTHLLFIDADIGFTPDQVFRLLDSGYPVVGGCCPKRSIQVGDMDRVMLEYAVNPLAQPEPPAASGFARVQHLGTGFLMIERSVLERLCALHPDLEYTELVDGVTLKSGQFGLFDTAIHPATRHYMADDTAFCHRVAQAGFEIWGDTASRLTHSGLTTFVGDVSARAAAAAGAVRIRPPPAMEAAMVRIHAGQFEAAEALCRRALAGGYDPVDGRCVLALALLSQGRAEEAAELCRSVLVLDPNAATALHILTQALLGMGRLEEGFACRERLRLASGNAPGHQPQPPQGRVWKGEPLAGQTLLIADRAGDGAGDGDWLNFCRFATPVSALGARVVLSVPARLMRLMATLNGPAAVLSDTDEPPAWDYYAPLLGLPYGLGTTLETIPTPIGYLRGDAAVWSDVLDPLPGVRVGLCWGTGRAYEPMDNGRSMRLADMAPLLDVPGCSFVSLQLGPPAAELRDTPLHDVSARLRDWQDSADLVAGLDLVISVDTAVAHLAGALGKPVWVLLGTNACWRWFQGRDDSPWYPTMRLFRQTTPGDWGAVIQRVKRELEVTTPGSNLAAFQKAQVHVDARALAIAPDLGPPDDTAAGQYLRER